MSPSLGDVAPPENLPTGKEKRSYRRFKAAAIESKAHLARLDFNTMLRLRKRLPFQPILGSGVTKLR